MLKKKIRQNNLSIFIISIISIIILYYKLVLLATSHSDLDIVPTLFSLFSLKNCLAFSYSSSAPIISFPTCGGYNYTKINNDKIKIVLTFLINQ